jgi:hypothetical protein
MVEKIQARNRTLKNSMFKNTALALTDPRPGVFYAS